MASGLLNFELHIAPEGVDGYSARLVDSPKGSLPAQPFVLPFSFDEIEGFVGQLLVASNRSSGLFRATVKQFGGMLFDALFATDVQVLLGRCRDEAERSGLPLAIRLRLHETPELAGLPWELLYDAGRDTFLAQDSRTPLVHSLELARSSAPLPATPLLRILVVMSSPQGVAPLDVEREWATIQNSLDEMIGQQKVELVKVQPATLDGVQRALSRQECHILHFVGHGSFEADAETGESRGALIFEDEEGNAQPVEAERLGRLLSNAPSLRLAVLNACEGARTALDDPFAGVAQTLLRQGLPSVIAMQFPISDGAGLIFAREFYASLADKHPIDIALTGARLAVYNTPESGSEWATPRLFLQAPDGLLWQLGNAKNEIANAQQDAAQTDRGLTALAALMQAPEVRGAVVAFQTDLEAAGEQINLLGSLKELHDHLHNVEFQCYRVIQQEAARFPADDVAVDNLTDNQLTLHDLVEKVQATAQRPVLHDEETGWSDDLAEADRLLTAAVKQSDATPLRRCVQLLKRLLTREAISAGFYTGGEGAL